MRAGERGTSSDGRAGRPLPVLLVEPDELARRALSSLLTAHGYDLAGAVSHGFAALEIIRRTHVGVLLTEIALPDLPFAEFVGEARQRRAAMQIIAITGEGDAGVLADTLRAGVGAILSKYTPPRVLMLRIESTFAGGLLLDEITSAPLLAWLRAETGQASVVLPRREREVLELILEGHSTRSAAQHLGLAESTVKSHAAKAAARLGMKTSKEAAVEAGKRGLIASTRIDLRDEHARPRAGAPYPR